MPQTIELSIRNTSEPITRKIAVGTGDLGLPLRIPSQAKALYALLDNQTGFAPHTILIKRIGNHLGIGFKKNGQPDLIIEDFYNQESAGIVGLAENQEYYYYVPESGDKASFIPQLTENSPAVWHALGPVEAGHDFPWMWVAGLAGLGLIAAAAGGGGGSDSTPANQVANITSQVKSISEDTTTALTGQLEVTDADIAQNGHTITQNNTAGSYGTFSVDGNGVWSYTLKPAQATIEALNTHQTLTDTFVVKSADGSASGVVTVIIDGVDDAAALSIDAKAANTQIWYENTLNQTVNTNQSNSAPIAHTLNTLGITLNDVDGAGDTGYTLTISENQSGWFVDEQGVKLATDVLTLQASSIAQLNTLLGKYAYQPADLTVLSYSGIPSITFTVTLNDHGVSSTKTLVKSIEGYDDNKITIADAATHSFTGQGQDTVILKASATDGAAISSGDGNDNVSLMASGAVAFSGNDQDIVWGLATNLEIDLGTGNDAVYILDSAQATNIYGGSGNDVFAFSTKIADGAINTLKDFNLSADKLNFFDITDINGDALISLSDIVSAVHYDTMNLRTDITLRDFDNDGTAAHIWMNDITLNTLSALETYVSFNLAPSAPSF